jgi:hypothetical protein
MQGAKENISDPKWSTNSIVSDATNDAPTVVEDSVRISMTSNEGDSLQRISRKRTNANRILSPCKPLQKRSSSEANHVLTPVKLLPSPEKTEKRRKPVRKSLRRSSVQLEDIQVPKPRRKSLRQSAVFSIASMDLLPELPVSLEESIVATLSEPKENSVTVEVTELGPGQNVRRPVQSASQPEAEAVFDEGNEISLTAAECTSRNPIAAEVGENREGTSGGLEHGIVAPTAPEHMSEREVFVFTGAEEKLPGAELAVTPDERSADPFLEEVPKPDVITTPVGPIMTRRSATEKPSTRHTTRVTRRSLRSVDLPSSETLRVTRSKSPKKRAVTFDPAPAKLSTAHDDEAADSDDEAIHQQLFDCPSPRKAALEATVRREPCTSELLDDPQSSIRQVQRNMSEERPVLAMSDSLIPTLGDEIQKAEEAEEAHQGEILSHGASEVEQAQQLDHGSPSSGTSFLTETTNLFENHPTSTTPDLIPTTEVDQAADDSILSNDPFIEDLAEDSVQPGDDLDETKTTIESFELMEPIGVSLTTETVPYNGEEDDTDELANDLTANVTRDAVTDGTQELKSANYDHDDTDVLLEFLNRVKADKAAKAVQGPTKKKRSLPHSPLRLSLGDEGVDELASLEIIPKYPFDVSVPTESPKKRRKTARAKEAEDTTEPQEFRRSGRTRLPVTKSLLPAPNFISIARTNGDTTINLKKDHDKELAALTRNNTRKNKGAALHPQALLMKQASGKESPASRHKALKEVFEEQAHRSIGKNKKSVVWAEELAQFQSLDKKEPLAAVVGNVVGVVKIDKRVELPKLLETPKEAAAPVEEKKEEKKETKKSSIPRVSMKSKIALGMAVNGTPARKMRKRL